MLLTSERSPLAPPSCVWRRRSEDTIFNALSFSPGVLNILVVEDNPGDVRLMQEALQPNGRFKRLHVVDDGEKAIGFLTRAGEYSAAARPDLIFLDLNLPKRDGRDVLATIKADPELRKIPVIILSTSEADRDIQHAYDLHANCYVRKPNDLDEYLTVIRACETFWLHIVRLP